MKILDLEINYLELSYIAEIEGQKAKEIFQQILDVDKVKRNELLKVSVLVSCFGNIRSLDPRYDGENKLIFFLNHKSENYKKFLSHIPTIKKRTLLGGKSILLKIMNEKQLKHFHDVINKKHNLLPASYRKENS